MRTPAVFFSFLLIDIASAGTAFAQYRGNPTPVFQGMFGNVVFPAGTAAIPGVQRFFPNVVFPAGNPPQLSVPYSVTDPTRLSAQFARNRGFVGIQPGYSGARRGAGRGSAVLPYAVPIYVGGYAGYTGYYDGAPVDPSAAAAVPGASQPNVIVVYPSAPPSAPPSGSYGEAYAPAPGAAAPTADQAAANPPPSTSYLIAFKDHTIYSAVAYWVEGDTLHYFTSGATHNQVSLSLVDRDLTLRLNQEAGNSMQLPAN
ncbi:MAG: hypothetical protein JOZ22_20725 [Acidobacteriia bacterium]|nr:hypothetical protein [Terriglobia bacterium]